MNTEPSSLPLPRQPLFDRNWLIGIGICCFVFAAVIVWALREHTRSGGEAELSPSELVEYKKWAATPLNLPAESLTAPPLPPLDHLEQRLALLNEFSRIGSSLTTAPEVKVESTDLNEKLDNLSGKENAHFLQSMPPLIEEIRDLADSPYYSLVPRLPHLDLKHAVGYDSTQMHIGAILLSFYIKLTASLDDLDTSFEALDTLLRLLHCDPYVPYMDRRNYSWLIVYVVDAVGVIETKCQDPRKLQQLCDLLIAHRSLLLQDIELADFYGEQIQLAIRMKSDGFIDELDLTPRGLWSVELAGTTHYEKWLAQNLALDDPRIQAKTIHADKTGNRVSRTDWGYYVLGSVLGIITYGIDHFFLPRQWKQIENQASGFYPIDEELDELIMQLKSRINSGISLSNSPDPA